MEDLSYLDLEAASSNRIYLFNNGMVLANTRNKPPELGDFHLRLVGRIGPERPGRNCPRCGSYMTSGSIQIHGEEDPPFRYLDKQRHVVMHCSQCERNYSASRLM